MEIPGKANRCPAKYDRQKIQDEGILAYVLCPSPLPSPPPPPPPKKNPVQKKGKKPDIYNAIDMFVFRLVIWRGGEKGSQEMQGLL